MEQVFNEHAQIKVIGVGGGGNNIIKTMKESGLNSVEYIAVNTDAQALNASNADVKLRIGKKGTGAGANPEVGRKAAEESLDEISKLIEGCDMVFITAGMGGGTGTGAAPVIAGLCKQMGILTVAVVTKPFSWEGVPRMDQALKGIQELNDNTDAIIVIPNNKLKDYVKQKSQGTAQAKNAKPMGFKEALQESDNVTLLAVQGICDLIQITGIINLDFQDVTTTLESGGSCLMGIGSATGEGKAQKATLAAMQNPLLEHGIENAKSVIFNVTGGPDFAFEELDEVSELIYEQVDREKARIIMGAVQKEDMDNDEIRVTIVATGFDHDPAAKPSANENRNLFTKSPRQTEERSFGEVEQPKARPVDNLNEKIPSFLLGKRNQL